MDRFSKHTPYESNRQFNSVCNPKSIGLLKEMLGRFIPITSIGLIITMIKNNDSDLKILEKIKNIHLINKKQLENAMF